MPNPFAGFAPIEIPARAPKAVDSYDRSVPISDTLERVPGLRSRYGITRVGDTTYLDRTLIPTFCAVVPQSPDLIGVYNGKGRSREVAMVSAVMEAVERQVAAACVLPEFPLAVSEVLQYVDVRAMGLLENAPEFVTCVPATSLFDGRVVPMPLAAVRCPWFGERLFGSANTNGLASGNNIVEALYHGLLEAVERHVWSMYFVRSQLLPHFYLGSNAADVAHGQEIQLPSGCERVDELVSAIRSAGFELRALALAEGPLPIVVLASIVDARSDPPMAHTGLGCSLSAAHALERALTECVQSRVTDIQGAREDLLRPWEESATFGNYARRQTALPVGRWHFDLPCEPVRLDELPDTASDDVARDLRSLLGAIRIYGVESVFAVDLAAPDVCVARVVVPEFETTSINGRIGLLARREFNPFHVQT